MIHVNHHDQSPRSMSAVHSSSSAQRSQHSVDRSSSRDYYDIVIIGKTGIGKSTLGNKLLQDSPTTSEQMMYSTQFNRGVGALDKCGTFPRFLTADGLDFDDDLTSSRRLSITYRCQLVANENTKIRVLDTPPLSDYLPELGGTSFEANLSICRWIVRELLDPNNKMSVERLLYFFPLRGIPEITDYDLLHQFKLMHHCFGSAVFKNMVVIATQHQYQSFEVTKGDFGRMQEILLLTIMKATDGMLSECPPIVYIGLNDTCEEILHKIKTARVLGKRHFLQPCL